MTPPPLQATRPSLDALQRTARGEAGGVVPYLFGRDPRLRPAPHPHHWWNAYCAFEANITFDTANFEADSILRETAKRGPDYWDTCPLSLRQQLLTQLGTMQQHELLAMTPCDLWPYVAGRCACGALCWLGVQPAGAHTQDGVAAGG